MNVEQMTERVADGLNTAYERSLREHNTQTTPEHLLAAFLEQERGIAPDILAKAGADLPRFTRSVDSAIGSLPRLSGSHAESASPSAAPELTRLLDVAQTEAKALGDDFVSVEHVLLAMAQSSGSVAKVFRESGITKARLLAALRDVRGNQRVTTRDPEGSYQSLERYGRDRTDLARRGKLDPVIGRDEEIRRVIQVLSRRTKNNPVLIGEPEVGKTAIVEGLANRIVEGDVPEGLRNKRLIALDLSAMVAGAKYRGEFEERLRSVLKEITESEGQVITFLDEVHTIVGAGAAEGALDAGNIIKPMLSRGELRMIGATTLDEYRKNIEKAAALESRFQPVYVGPPSVDDTVAILRGLKERYEVHHGVRIQDAALVAAAVLSDRYISGRFLPDKAIDLIDEAASKLRIEIDSMPTEIDIITRRARQLEIERVALAKETDLASMARLDKIDEELANLREQETAMTVHWQSERDAIMAIRERKERLESRRGDAERFERDGNLGASAEIRYGELPVLEQEIVEATKRLADLQEHQKMLKEEVDAEDIAEVVSRWTGVPISRLMQGEVQKLIKMEDVIRERVIGQDEAVLVVSNAIRRSRAGLSDPGRPIGSFLFLGPTGVGKTELARALAEFLFDDD